MKKEKGKKQQNGENDKYVAREEKRRREKREPRLVRREGRRDEISMSVVLLVVAVFWKHLTNEGRGPGAKSGRNL